MEGRRRANRTGCAEALTWFLTVAALTLWLFRKWIIRQMAPFLPDKQARHRFLGVVIAAFAIVAAVRLVVRMVSG